MPTYYSSNADGDLDTVYLHNYEEYLLTDTFVTEGRLWLWGRNNAGQIGDNSITNRSSPVQTVSGGTNWKVLGEAGAATYCAIKTDGTLWLWGSNGLGELGDNTIVSKSSPVQTVAGGTNWKQIETNYTGNAPAGSFCAAIKTDGSLWTWGNNTDGQLGDNSTTLKSSPVQTVSGGTNWRQVAAAARTAAAIKTDGTLWTWGNNVSGQLGDNTVISKSSPVQTVAGGTNWKQVNGGLQSSFFVATKTDGTLWLWGSNSFGELGNNANGDKTSLTVNAQSSPIQTVAGGTNWKQVYGGYYQTIAIKTDGTLWLWGRNDNGQLGDNTVIAKSSPVQTVAGGTNWRFVSGGGGHVIALKTDGTMWTWGDNTYGQLGDNTITKKSSPIQTIAGGTNWRSVSCGSFFSVATTY